MIHLNENRFHFLFFKIDLRENKKKIKKASELPSLYFTGVEQQTSEKWMRDLF